MAIGAGSIVALKVACAGLTIGAVNPQPPLFGVVETSLPGSVIWYNGNVAASVPVATVDEILDPGPTTAALVGQVVEVTTDDSSAYRGIVVGAYSRSGVDSIVLKTLSNGAFFEVAASTVNAVTGV